MKKETLANFIVCSSTNQEAFDLERECNITDAATIHIITDEVSEASLFQRMDGDSETTVEELNKSKSISRIIVGPNSQAVIDESLSRGWNEDIWSGIVIAEVEEIIEYRKVYPVYTS